MPTLPLATLAAAQQPAADTLVVVSARSGLESAAVVSVVVIGVFFLLLLPIVFLLFVQIRKVNRTVRELGEKGLRRADPLIESGKAAMDNVEFISMAVRTDVERITTSVKSLSDRLQQTSDRMEERIAEFNALMEVVQSEAEDIFMDTAATVRGVREGARSLAASGASTSGEPDEEELRLANPSDEEPLGEAYVSRPEPGR
jgi:methyl-accepting chemotaxis protein